MNDFVLNKAKSLTSLLYICHKLGGSWDKYSLLKILYFAEEKHLVKYGRPITGDNIIAMKHGPVPSCSYDMVKPWPENERYFSIEDDVVTAKESPDLDFLSRSEISCLDESIAENRDLNFSKLKAKSHTKAYTQTVETGGLNSKISYLEIAKESGAKDSILNYISERIDFRYWS